MYFRNLVLSAFVIAIFSGIIFSAYQAYFITPLIVNSEVYEVVEPVGNQIEVWVPEDGMERNSWSYIANFLICFAYTLILLSAMSLKTSVNVVKGVFWGGAAYVSVFAAPALGLPPEIPGMEAAHLEGRQSWWLLTVALTAIACWLIAFQGNKIKVLGLVLLFIPHIIGAPQPEIHGFANINPQAVKELTRLWHDFILQTSVANALLWILIGGLSGFFTEKFIIPIDARTQHSITVD